MTLVALFIFSFLLISNKSQAQEDDEEDTFGRPWKNPLQELQAISPACSLKIPDFAEMTSREQSKWQSCVDKITLPITEKFPVLESRSNEQEDSKINSSIIHEIDKELHMVICRNTTAYKSCWYGIIEALNACDPGIGDSSGTLYFALYDDICREGGRLTVETRQMAALEGELCDRDYLIPECKANRENMHAKDLCLRFQSNVACDLGSIDPDCQNKIDKEMHGEIFKRVEGVLGCHPLQSTPETDTGPSSSSTSIKGASGLLFLLITITLTFSYILNI